ncbi:hypothetical protein DL93DRAFT_1975097 [Clavulina sp. PMI_390]|nr:hypothetical protein DL93DRAFT_1975097 [Clavulina sp. PMI_390]
MSIQSFGREFLPELRHQLLSYLRISDLRAYSRASWASHNEALPFIWRNIDICPLDSEDSATFIASFFCFVLQHPHHAAYIRRLSIYWNLGVEEGTPPESSLASDAHTTEDELFKICSQAGLLFTGLKTLRLVFDQPPHEQAQSVPSTILESLLGSFQASPTKFLLVDSVVGVPPEIMPACAVWEQTLTHLMIDEYGYHPASLESLEASRIPQLPHLRVFVTRDSNLLFDVVKINPHTDSIHLLNELMGSSYLTKLPAVISGINTWLSPVILQGPGSSTSSIQLQSATLCFSATEFILSNFLRALRLPSLRNLTIHVGSEDLPWNEVDCMLTFAIDEFTQAFPSIHSTLPSLAKFRMRLQDTDGNLPAYIHADNQTKFRTSAASRFLDALEHPSWELRATPKQLRNIELWCKSSRPRGGRELGILRASLSNSQWEITESINPHLKDDWELHFEENELPDCFASPMEPLSLVEEHWCDI